MLCTTYHYHYLSYYTQQNIYNKLVLVRNLEWYSYLCNICCEKHKSIYNLLVLISAMLFRSVVIAALSACAYAKSSIRRKSEDATIIPDFNIPTDSKFGKRLLSKARRLENNNGNNQNEQGEWLAGYSLQYDSCASLIQVREEGGGDEEGILYTQNLVKFKICPGNGNGNGNCNDCGSGVAQYVVNMIEFVDVYTEMKMDEQERICENIREYCYCDNANDDEVCENQCYADAGYDSCIEYEGGDEFEIQSYLECAEMEGADGNNNGNNQNRNYNQQSSGGVDMYRQYWIGPMCSPSDGKSIYMAAFFDAGCTSHAGTGVYEAFHYGYPLPYENEPIVALDDCLSCLQVDEDQNNNGNNNNNNQNQNMEVAQICEESYEKAAKCEAYLGSYLGQYYYTDTSGCEYINNVLPNLEKATRKISSGSVPNSSMSGSGAATACAVIFALTSTLLGAYAFFLYRKIHRAKVNLAQAEMGMN